MSRRYLVLSVLIASILYSCGNAKLKEHSFTAKVSSVRLSSILINQGNSRDSNVAVQVPARMFKEVLEIENFNNAENQGIPEIDRLIEYHKTMSNGTPEQVLDFWLPNEREQKAKTIHNPEMFTQVQAYFSENPRITIHGIIYQNESSSVLLDLGGYVTGHTFRNLNDHYYLSDNPTDDLELAIIEASFVKKAKP